MHKAKTAQFLWYLFATLAAAVVLAASARADQLVMKNGDRVTGSIVKQDGKTVTIKTVNFGLVTPPWEQVASIQSDQPLTVVLKNGKTLAGTLAPSGNRIEVASAGTKVLVDPGEITALRNADEQRAYQALLAPGLLDLWSGVASLGWAGTEGNSKTLSLTVSADAARVTNTDKTSIYFNVIKASALVNGTTATTAQAARGGIAYNRNLNPRLFGNIFNDYEYDKFQDLDLRVVAGGGLGYHVVKGTRSALDALAGVDYDHSHFSTPLTRNAAEIYWGDDYALKLTGASSLTQSFRMFDKITGDPGAYRINFDLALVTKLKKWLTWNAALSDRYLSDPVPGRKTNDWIYSTGVGVAFGKTAP